MVLAAAAVAILQQAQEMEVQVIHQQHHQVKAIMVGQDSMFPEVLVVVVVVVVLLL